MKFKKGDRVKTLWLPIEEWEVIEYSIGQQMNSENAIYLMGRFQAEEIFNLSHQTVICKRFDAVSKSWITKEIPENKLELINF